MMRGKGGTFPPDVRERKLRPPNWYHERSPASYFEPLRAYPCTATKTKGDYVMQLRVSLAFARLPDKELDNFTLGVKDGVTGNAAYATPPVTMVNLEAARVDFEQKIAKAASGGPPDTA